MLALAMSIKQDVIIHTPAGHIRLAYLGKKGSGFRLGIEAPRDWDIERVTITAERKEDDHESDVC